MPDNVTSNAITDCRIEKRVSKKSGSMYSVLVITFKNGYKFETFLNNEQVYIIGSIVPQVQA